MECSHTQKEMWLWLEKCYGAKEAIVDYPQGSRWTFAALNDYARRICASYRRDGSVRKGDRITWLSLTPSCEITAVSFGARKMGAIPVIMNARAGIDTIAWMIKNVDAKSVAYTTECAETAKKLYETGLPGVREYIALGDQAGLPGEVQIHEIWDAYKGAEEPPEEILEEDDCFICYTSGTTGRPKAVLHREAEWCWTNMVTAYQFGLYHHSTFLNAMAPSFVGWAHAVCGSLRAAAKQCCLRFIPSTYISSVSDERPTHAILSPTLVRMLYEEYSKGCPERLNGLRVALVSGEPVTEDVIRMLGEMFPNVTRMSSVGATEAISLTTGPNCEHLNDHWDSVGKPVPGMIAELRDVDSGEVIEEADRRGELFVKGPGVCGGIWNDAAATEKQFPGGFWKTGDILYRDAEGYYYYSGRTDYMFKSGGIKVYSVEVEAYLKRHPAILDAVVVPTGDSKFGWVPFAHVRSRTSLSSEEMEKWWFEQDLPRYNRPRKWCFWGEGEFPMITPVKVDRRRLLQLASEGEQASDSKGN